MKNGIVVIGLVILVVGMFFVAVKEIQIGTQIVDIGWGIEYEVPRLLKTEIKNGIGFVILLLGLIVTVYGAMSQKSEGQA